MPADDLPQPFSLVGDRPVHPPSQVRLDVLELRPHAVASGLPQKLEVPFACFPADEREPQEGEGLRFAEPALLAVDCSEAAKLNQAGLVRMERQHEPLKPRAHRSEEATSVALALETDDQVIGITHDDHVAGGLALSPALGPQVEHVVQVDVPEQR